MNLKPLRPCNKQGCRSLTKNKYCKDHEHLNSETNRIYDKFTRDKKANEFYHSSVWKAVREQAMVRDNGLCVRCIRNKKITPAYMVDHIKPIKIAWELRATLSNLQSMCDSCHKKKTAEDIGKYKK